MSDILIFSFRSIGVTPPHIVDVDWRLDYYIKVCESIISILLKGPSILLEEGGGGGLCFLGDFFSVSKQI